VKPYRDGANPDTVDSGGRRTPSLSPNVAFPTSHRTVLSGEFSQCPGNSSICFDWDVLSCVVFPSPACSVSIFCPHCLTRFLSVRLTTSLCLSLSLSLSILGQELGLHPLPSHLCSFIPSKWSQSTSDCERPCLRTLVSVAGWRWMSCSALCARSLVFQIWQSR